jgi:DNA-binding XRE family transcriptional regulator
MKIGCNIRKIREMKNIRQDYIAQQLNLSLTSYGKIERDEVDLNLTRVHQIACVLDVSVNLLISFNVNDILSISKQDVFYYQQVIGFMQENIRQLNLENSKLLQMLEKVTSMQSHL